MSNSNNEGRNQKLVIDYLAALLDDSELIEDDSDIDSDLASLEANLEAEAEAEAEVAAEEAEEAEEENDGTETIQTSAIESTMDQDEIVLQSNATQLQDTDVIDDETLELDVVKTATNQPEPEPEPEPIETEDVNIVSKTTQVTDVEPQATELSINCVIVLMYGLKLAIPFEDIEGMIKLSNVSLSLTSDRNWILGDFSSATMGTHVVDTAQILFGDNYNPIKSNYKEMLVLSGKHWSIVFDKVIKAQNILLRDVTENPSPQFRPWLTGTYLAEKCALVNVKAMVKMFDDELNS